MTANLLFFMERDGNLLLSNVAVSRLSGALLLLSLGCVSREAIVAGACRQYLATAESLGLALPYQSPRCPPHGGFLSRRRAVAPPWNTPDLPVILYREEEPFR